MYFAGLKHYLVRLPGRIRRSPGKQLKYLVLLFGVSIAVVWFASSLPWLLPLLLLLTVIWWYKRTSAGLFTNGQHSLPSSNCPFQFSYFSDHDFLLQQKKKLGSIFKIHPLLSPTICIVDLPLASAALSDHAPRLTTPKLPFEALITHGFLRSMRGDVHLKYRRWLARAVSPRLIDESSARLRCFAEKTIEQMCLDSQQSGGRGIDPLPHVESMLFGCWMQLFYDMQSDHEDYVTVRDANTQLEMNRAGLAPVESARSALLDIIRIVYGPSSGTQTQNSRSSFLTCLQAEMQNTEKDDTAVANLVYMFTNGFRDVVGLSMWIIKMLVDHPEWFDKVRNESANDNIHTQAQPSRRLSNRIVLETLRLRQSEYLWRRANDKIELNGVRIPKNSLIRICIRECHRDESVFSDALAFNPDRFKVEDYSKEQFAPFGMHHHACVGQHLTITVASLLVEEMVRRYDWRSVKDGAPQFSDLNGHWQPNESFRVELVEI